MLVADAAVSAPLIRVDIDTAMLHDKTICRAAVSARVVYAMPVQRYDTR